MESCKSQIEELNSMNLEMGDQLSVLREENESLKQNIASTSQNEQNQINQILRLNSEIAKLMEDKDKCQAELDYWKEIYDTTDAASTPAEVTEGMKYKIEEVRFWKTAYM